MDSDRPRVNRVPRFLAEEMWEGVLLEMFDGYFAARLSTFLTNHPDEYAEIYVKEVSVEDLHLVEEGATFTWSIGYLDSASGQRTGVSVLRFRRLPAIQVPAADDPWIKKVQASWNPSAQAL